MSRDRQRLVVPGTRRLALIRRVAVILTGLMIVLAAVPLGRAQTPAPAGGGAAAATVPTSGSGSGGGSKLVRTTVGEAFFVQRNPQTQQVEVVGTILIWLLIGLSVTCTSMIGTQLWAHRRRGYVPDALNDALKRALYEKKLEPAFSALAGENSMLASVVGAGLRQARHGYLAMVRAAEQRADEVAVRKLRTIEPLNIIGNVAPMLGLFGTVYGIILSFREIVASGGAADPVALAAGIGTALVATFWGLVVAIPALAFYGVLRSRIDSLTVEAAAAAEELIATLKPTEK